MMKKTFFFIILLLLTINIAHAIGEVTLILNTPNTEILDDAVVEGDEPTTNFGSATRLSVGNGSVFGLEGYPARSYLKFSIDQLPPNSTIQKATLGISRLSVTGSPDSAVYQLRNSSWDEETITYNNQPCGTNFDNSTFCNLTADSEFMLLVSSIDINITRIVSSDYDDGLSNISLVIKQVNESVNNSLYHFYSKEYSVAKDRPNITIQYLSETPTVFLNSPDNATYNTNPLSFNCSALSGINNLVNISLWSNFSGSWQVNETKQLLGKDNSTIFSISPGDGSYIWNCQAYNNKSIQYFSSVNYTVNIDSTPPQYTNFINNASGSVLFNDSVKWSVNLSDNLDLSSYIFSHNVTGSFDNQTQTAIDSNPIIINYNLTINATRGTNVCGKFYFNDTSGNNNITNTSCFVVANTAPVATALIINKPIESTENLTVSITFSDVDGDSWSSNETRWFNGSQEMTDFVNLTTVFFGNTTSDQIWTVSVRVNDGFGDSLWVNDSVVIGDTVPPLLSAYSLPKQQWESDEFVTVNINCTDTGSNIDFVKFFIQGESANRTATEIIANQYYVFNSSTFGVGEYNITDIYCKDISGNINETSTNLNFTVVEATVTVEVDSGGGGGSGTTPLPTCNISFSPPSITFFVDEFLQTFVLSNHENFSITPSYTFNDEILDLITFDSIILGNDNIELGLIKAQNITVPEANETLEITFPECQPVVLNVSFSTARRQLDFLLVIGNIEEFLRTRLPGTVNLFGTEIQFYFLLFLSLIPVIAIAQFFGRKLSAKITGGVVIFIILNTLLLVTLSPTPVEATDDMISDDMVNASLRFVDTSVSMFSEEITRVQLAELDISIEYWVLAVGVVMVLAGIALALPLISWAIKVPVIIILVVIIIHVLRWLIT